MSIESRRETEYLVFERHQSLERGTTYVYSVSNKTETVLGWIRWHGPWRKYVYKTLAVETIFDSKCLLEIYEFLNALMKDWKETKQ